MPDPREAVYDVLNAKWQRQKEAEVAAARARESGFSWADYEADNQRANSAYRSRARGR